MTFISNKREFISRVQGKSLRILHQVGAYGRTTMARLFPRRKSSASAGAPPHAHVTGKRGLKDVRYAVDVSQLRVVVGHVPYRAKARRDKRGRSVVIKSAKRVPDLLNSGGAAMAYVDGLPQKLNYRGHPFQQRALNIAAQKMGQLLSKERV